VTMNTIANSEVIAVRLQKICTAPSVAIRAGYTWETARFPGRTNRRCDWHETHQGGAGLHRTHHWRELDSNLRFRARVVSVLPAGYIPITRSIDVEGRRAAVYSPIG